jgi:hypothetical protein
MFDVRWYVPKSQNGIKPVLQYRHHKSVDEYDETLKKSISYPVWSEWKNVPIVEEK